MTRIALLSSNRPRCGISTYTCYLEGALRGRGAEVRHWGTGGPIHEVFSEIRKWDADIFHVQHEQSIMPPNEDLERFARERGPAKSALTLHTETPSSAQLASSFGATIVHKPPEFVREAHVLAMPCPVFDPPSRAHLRWRYKFPRDAFVVSTVGFLLPWKKTAEIAEALLPWVASTARVYLQIIASQHFNPQEAQSMRAASRSLERLSSSTGGRVRHVAHYPSDQEVLERLSLSDLGYVYCPFDTGSSSAAASLFVSARCPLVTSTSTHYDHLMCHSVRAPKEDVAAFAQRVVQAADDADLILRLRERVEFLYAETNYQEFATKHLRIYGS